MDPRLTDEVSITDLFDQFIEASTMRTVLSIHHRILNYSDLNPCEFNVFFPKLKSAVMTNRVRKNWKAKALFSKIDKRAAHRCYSNTKVPTPVGNQKLCDNQNGSHNSQECLNDSVSSQQSANKTYYSNNALQHYNCLVIGSGPAGLRTAIELQLLGASRVVVVEKRSRFSRNNVLHLWPFVIDDLKSLGAKKFYGKFCAGSIDHISIRQLQLILLKICLMIGCDFRDSCSYLYLCPTSIKQTKQVTISETSSDNKQVYGSSDSAELFSCRLKCDLEDIKTDEEQSTDTAFVKVSDNLSEESNGQANQQKEGLVQEQDENVKNIDIKNETEQNDDQQKQGQAHSKGDPVGAYSSIEICPKSIPTKTQADIHTNRRGDYLRGARAHFQSEYQLQEKELHSYEWDVIIGADGRRNTLSKFFPRKEFRGRLAIAITANFINRQTPAEASVSEISGLSFIYNQDMFNALAYDTNIQLENICYYKDDTHYFVMTAKKKSLLERGVLKRDYATTQDLLSDENVNRQALFTYAKDAAYWTTGLEPLDFALNHYGQEDCAMFDFTSMYAASNACKALRTRDGGLALFSLVGDSLLEPFWPTGSGCARGFLSSFDAAWMCRQWAVNKCALIDSHGSNLSRSTRARSTVNDSGSKIVELMGLNKLALSVIAERESIYRILAQTTSENLQQNYSRWTINPHSRYPNLNRHLVTPSQVEHLVTDTDSIDVFAKPIDRNKLSVVTADRSRRVKSPNNSNHRKSSKKLKSANASPIAQPKISKGRLRSSSRGAYRSKSRNDVSLDETYVEFEKSYNNLADDEKAPSHYLNYRQHNRDVYDELFIPSISGTLPSSNNLLSLEARRARDIDECLRQRRQKTRLSVVRDQLIEKFQDDGTNGRNGTNIENPIIPGGAALYNELRRLKDLQARGKENKSKETSGPLTLLNSIRRCASFAERVKSFENKLGSSSQESTSTATTPRTPIDDVKNLPQFVTLQELFVNNSASVRDSESSRKSKIPIMKLSKDDWNVKCWENRLTAQKQRNSRDLFGSTKSLNKSVSVDVYNYPTAKPERQIEIFKGRIKEMADKLKKTRDYNRSLSKEDEIIYKQDNFKADGTSQGWVSHIRSELIKGLEGKQQNVTKKQPMNPVAPDKPIKKLFEDDDDEEDDGINVNKHYDHLCTNRPTNKYLNKKGYTSHLSRIRYNSATSKVVNQELAKESRRAYVAALNSRNSSASSTLSDYSTNTGGSSSGGGGGGVSHIVKYQQAEVKCSRCKTQVNQVDSISIGDSALHRHCLSCANCGITLITNEIQHYLNLQKEADSNQITSFVCAICKPNIRENLTKEAANRLSGLKSSTTPDIDAPKARLRSREEFLNERVNYNELYRNILDDNRSNNETVASKIESIKCSSSCQTPVTASDLDSKKSPSLEYEDAKSKQDSLSVGEGQLRDSIESNPIDVNLRTEKQASNDQPCTELYGDDEDETKFKNEDDCAGGFRIARSETVDGSEQVTLILPSTTTDSDYNPRAMIDEEELERILHPDNPASDVHRVSSSSKNHAITSERQMNGKQNNRADRIVDEHQVGDDQSEEDDDSSGNTSDESKNNEKVEELSDDPSSLNSPPSTDDYEDDDGEDANENIDQNSTYEDFLTSEEFGAASDREDEVSPSDPNQPGSIGVTDE